MTPEIALKRLHRISFNAVEAWQTVQGLQGFRYVTRGSATESVQRAIRPAMEHENIRVTDSDKDQIAAVFANQTVASAAIAMDAAEIVLAHSICDVAWHEYCLLAATLAPDDWADLIKARTISFRTLSKHSHHELVSSNIREVIGKTSLTMKAELLRKKAGAAAGVSLQQYQYEKQRLARLDHVRNQIVHGSRLEKYGEFSVRTECDYLYQTVSAGIKHPQFCRFCRPAPPAAWAWTR